MAQGKVKWFSQSIGGGFIRTEEGQDVFFRVASGYDDDPKVTQRGQSVSFEIRKKNNGLSLTAINVKASDCSLRST